MIYIATTISDEKIDLGPAYTAEINKSKDAPADSLNVVFPSIKEHSEYKYIDVYINEDKKFFSGIVDEQKFEIKNNGCFLTIIARSKAAYLIDNEASPQTYKRPSLKIIFQRHIKPYGFKSIDGDQSSFNVTIEVEKGMSEWDVLEKFCSSCLNVFPIINSDGTIDATGKEKQNKIYFSNTLNGTRYSSIVKKDSRYKLISEIIVCAPYQALYMAKVSDQESINKGISRRKFISMSTESDYAKQVSVNTAEQMISQAKLNAHEITLTCPGEVYAQIGNKGEIDDSILGKIENLSVYEVEYTLNQKGETTRIKLLEE